MPDDEDGHCPFHIVDAVNHAVGRNGKFAHLFPAKPGIDAAHWFFAVLSGMNGSKLKVQSSKLKRMNKLKGTNLTRPVPCGWHG